MASLNTSINGPSISKSYQSIVDSPPPTGPAAASPTYGQWAVFSVSAPLANAFVDSGNKESVLKVQTTGEGELVDLIDEFSDGRIQFAFVKVRDSNTGLPKSALIAWCGEGVPERTKGYFTSHMTAVAKLLHGYHVQVTARSDRDLTPESIVQKIADASGSKYSSSSAPPPVSAATKPAVTSKPVFTPTQISGGSIGYNPLANRTAKRSDNNTDEDGWGQDAPPVTRSQLEKVQPAYQPTKVNMRELTSQKTRPSAFSNDSSQSASDPDVVRGGYQPIGKVDIAAIRRQAKESGNASNERAEPVKGSYEPVGRVDIAAIRAKAQKPDAVPAPMAPSSTGRSEEADGSSPSLAQRSAAFSSGPERLTTMPKPKVANKFGGSSNFTGTRAPLPGGFEARPAAAAPVGGTSRTFADQGGKTPAQIWAEKKARERGISGSDSGLPPSGFTGQTAVVQQKSGGGQWESGYSGKKWGSVQTTHTGQSKEGSVGAQRTGDAEPIEEEEVPSQSTGGIGSIRDRFTGAAPMGAPALSNYDRPAPPTAPEPEASTKPNRGVPIPGLAASASRDDDTPVAPSLPSPPRQPRSPTPPTPEARDISPIRIAVPVSKTQVSNAHEEQMSPPPAMPSQSLSRAATREEDDEPETGPDPGRAAAQASAISSMGHAADDTQAPESSSERAKAEYDYDAAEDNEVSLREGEIVTDIQKIDPDWWLVTNTQGQTGLVPSNYLSPLDDDEPAVTPAAPVAATSSRTPAASAAPAAPAAAQKAPSAIAEYDYEAAEDNEISFPEGATITNIEFPDDDWWHGEYDGDSGLFPAAYVKLQQ